MRTDEELSARTIKIIEAGGRILLRKGAGRPKEGDSYWFMHAWTNVAAGPDNAIWTGGKRDALEFFNLKWALTLAPLYGAKVIVSLPKKKNA
jgi:hypothetical protein